MKFGTVSVAAEIDAPAARLYGILADYRGGHPRILPPCFSPLEIVAGGRGAGTRLRFTMRVMGVTQRFDLEVSEPEPGRVLKEVDRIGGAVTLFTVEPRGAARSRVSIATDFLPMGAAGVVQFLTAAFVVRRIYRQELALFAALAARAPGA